MFDTSKSILTRLRDDTKISPGSMLSLSTLQNLYEVTTHVVPVKIEGKYNFKESVKSEETIAALARIGVAHSNYLDILNLYKGFSYSKWCNIRQTTYPEFSSLVPIPLAALKFTKGINYNEWDLDSSGHGFGQFLANALTELNGEVYNTVYSCITSEIIHLARQTKRPFMPTTLPEPTVVTELWNAGFGSTTATRFARILLGQMWLAGEARVPGKMILHATDWDKTPEFVPVKKQVNLRLTEDF